ncbi:MAG TPA: hypothetical protein VGS20_13530 [Candidatus Acidoferrales bacterium]|nr:hypothetical protein [Candidatus Acidoferrales bacterium]
MGRIEPGVGITAATAAILVAEYGRTRRCRLPLYGWAGLAILAVAEWLMFRGVEPVATYFTPIAWTAYILVADAAVFAIRGHSRLRSAPGRLAGLALLSIPLWLVFEAYNLRLRNWTYTGVPSGWLAAGLGYGWSFATIWPGLFETADLVEAFGWFLPGRPIELSRRTERVLASAGLLLLAAPLLLPQRAAAREFGLVWLGFALLLDPVNHWLRRPSILGDFSRGRRGRLYSLLASGWVCGWLWEFWNYWAAAKWHYIFPMFQHWKIFEMPAPGFLGFLPFAVECFAMYAFVAGTLRWHGEA